MPSLELVASYLLYADVRLHIPMTHANDAGPDATWELTKEGYLLHPASGQCMSVEEHGGKASLAMVSCADNEKKLKWKLKFRSEFQHAKAAGPLRHDKQPHELANIVPL